MNLALHPFAPANSVQLFRELFTLDAAHPVVILVPYFNPPSSFTAIRSKDEAVGTPENNTTRKFFFAVNDSLIVP